MDADGLHLHYDAVSIVLSSVLGDADADLRCPASAYTGNFVDLHNQWRLKLDLTHTVLGAFDETGACILFQSYLNRLYISHKRFGPFTRVSAAAGLGQGGQGLRQERWWPDRGHSPQDAVGSGKNEAFVEDAASAELSSRFTEL